MPDKTKYGRRNDDIMLPTDMPSEVMNDLSESQKIHIKLLQNNASLNTAVNDLQHKVQILEEILITGKGSENPSLQERVRNIEKYISDLQYWGKFIGGALVIQTLSFFAGIVIAVVQFLPLLKELAQRTITP